MPLDTIPAQFLHSARTYDKPDAFRVKVDGRYRDISHRDALARVHGGAVGLQGLRLARGDRVAILSETRFEWAVADLAVLSIGCVTVPVYSTLPAEQVRVVLEDAEVRAIFVSTREQLEKIRACREHLPTLEHVIAFESDCAGDDVVLLDDVIARGHAEENQPDYESVIAPISPTDWASIIYTSGTTGVPKGVILTHKNFMTNVRQALDRFDITNKDTCLSFLPLSHVFERTAGFFVMMTAGTTIAYAESMDTVADNLVEVRPTVVLGVPRLYEKMYARVMSTVESGSALKKKLFAWGMDVGRRYLAANGKVTGALAAQKKIADALVFKKLKRRTGGRLHFFVSGGAPLAPEIAEFFLAAGVNILEGYGLTETSPVLAANTFEARRIGSVGKPFPGVDIRIADDGEILARGDNVMQGYYKKPEETAAALEDGWFHTGDIGHLDEDGFLFITDRKKELIVTAGGKKVAPQPIELALKRSPYIAEALVVGNRRKFVSVLIVPDFEKLLEFAAEHHIAGTTRVELVEAPQVVKLYNEELERICGGLASFQKPKAIAILDEELTVEKGELTPSLKVRRRVVEAKYEAMIDGLYA